jgi:hypothetical protein
MVVERNNMRAFVKVINEFQHRILKNLFLDYDTQDV